MNGHLKSEQNVNKQCWAEKKKWTRQKWHIRAGFLKKFTFFVVEICVYFDIKLVFQGNLRLFSEEIYTFFVAEICVYFVFFKEIWTCFRWNLRLLFKEICTCFVVEICTCFSMKLEPVFCRDEIRISFLLNFSLVFRWNFHLWVSRNFGFWRLYSKICEIWGWTQVWNWRE